MTGHCPGWSLAGPHSECKAVLAGTGDVPVSLTGCGPSSLPCMSPCLRDSTYLMTQLLTLLAPLGRRLFLLRLALNLFLLGTLPLQFLHYLEVLPLLFLLFFWSIIGGKGLDMWRRVPSCWASLGSGEAANSAPFCYNDTQRGLGGALAGLWERRVALAQPGLSFYLLCCFHFRHSTLWPCSPCKEGGRLRG